MAIVLRILDALCALGGLIAALASGGLAVMLIVEVIATSFFAWSQPWAVEYSSYLLCASLFAGAGWTLRDGGHVRVQILTDRLPEGAQRWADLLATVFALGMAGFAAMALVENAMRSFSLGSTSYYPTRTPLYWPQALLAFGFVVLSLGLLARAIRVLMRLPTEHQGVASAEEGAGLAGDGARPASEGAPA
ncbi:TRAP transporter small permease [Acuticoccus sediminis]|uniref:TRAP transporter small permease protein n=1 Tax=Acuticoccus sediminis TaxID=2184697 RepID=A0A8B2NMQ7_9HYPH|nr:TRAP transporter small permease [Acuticoccus sediminis]RAH97775.1 TRAP transporter small permease [Acuticoccus sediminis]